MSAFSEAFNIARKQGVSEFNFNGKRYNTRKRGETDSLWKEYLNGFKKPAQGEGFTLTAGTMNNNKFTPASTGANLGNNMDLARNYLTKRMVSLNTPLNRDAIRSYRDKDFSNVDEYYSWLGTDAGKNSDLGKIWNNYLAFTAGAENPEEARRKAFDAIMALAGVKGNLGRRDSRRLAEQLQKMNTNEYYDDFLRGFQKANPTTFEAVRTYLNNPVKHQLGGAINDEDKIKQAFAEFCKANNLQPNEDSWKQFQEYLQLIAEQQTLMAKLGAKLNYIKTIKGECPEGTEKYYFKAGGRICSVCRGMKAAEEGMEIQPGKPKKKAISKTVSDFRNLKISENDTVMVRGKAYGITPRGLKATGRKYGTPQYQEDLKKAKKGNRDANNRITKVDQDKCGGKMKKHLNGGSIDLVKLRSLLNLNK